MDISIGLNVTSTATGGSALPAYALWDTGQAGTNITYSGTDNLTISPTSGTAGATAIGNTGKSSGKYYFEITFSTLSGVFPNAAAIGLTTGSYNLITGLSDTGVDDFWYDAGGRTNTNGSPATTTGKTTWQTQGDVVGCAVDTATGKIWFKDKNGNWLTATNDADVAAGNNADFVVGSGMFKPLAGLQSGGADTHELTANFGKTSFTHSVPSGFSGWVL